MQTFYLLMNAQTQKQSFQLMVKRDKAKKKNKELDYEKIIESVITNITLDEA